MQIVSYNRYFCGLNSSVDIAVDADHDEMNYNEQTLNYYRSLMHIVPRNHYICCLSLSIVVVDFDDQVDYDERMLNYCYSLVQIVP
jgi:hypothetical protein